MLSALLIGFGPHEALAAGKKDGKQKETYTETEEGREDWVVTGDVLVKCRKEDAVIKVPDGIREIGPYAFEGLMTLETVKLADSVETIGEGAFSECASLRKVELSSKSRLKKIESKAFLNCVLLDKAFVPEGVTVAKTAFKGVPEKQEEEPVYYGPSGPRQAHAPNKSQSKPDYDLIALDELTDRESEEMEQLELGGEQLDLTVSRGNTEESAFTARTICWDNTQADEENREPDTLVLTAENGEDGTERLWKFNGELLRRMHKSGIEHLVLRTGNQIVSMETEGFLGGWAYNEMKSKGTANRRFEYQIEMNDQGKTVWYVLVNGEEFELTADEHTPMYLTGAYSGSAAMLEQPYSKLLTME